MWEFEKKYKHELEEREKYRELCPFNANYKCININRETFRQHCDEEVAEKCPYRPKETDKDKFREHLIYGF